MKSLFLAVTLLGALCGAAQACNLPPARGEVILVVSGMINACNDGLEVRFDRAMLDALPQHTIRTENPWDQGPQSYEGVRLGDLMDYVKADGKVMTLTALNDYRADIPLEDLAKFDILLADKRNGADLPVRDKGPLFVVFPFSDFPELKTEGRYAQSVWQVNRIALK